MKSAVKPKPADIILFICVIAAAVLLLLALTGGDSSGLVAVIETDGAELRRVELDSLSEPLKITVDGEYSAVIVLERGRVYIESSDCPNQDCVHSGAITRAGQALVCLPNRLSVRLIGGGGEADAYSG